MPLTTDEHTLKTGQAILGIFRKAFETDPGRRPIHSKGSLLRGSFTPSARARSLSIAPHFQNASTPISVRFSNSGGPQAASDKDMQRTSPKGLAMRFHLGENDHTDLILQNSPFFPAKTMDEFLGFFQALLGSSPPGSGLKAFLGSHPGALAAVTQPKHFPASFRTENYFSINAFNLVDNEGKKTTFRYRALPDAGFHELSKADFDKKSDGYLFDDINEYLTHGWDFGFRLVAQLAEEGDATNEATARWPEDRKIIELGHFVLEDIAPDNEKEQKQIIFDAMPRVEGVEPSDDPLIGFRSNIYLMSGKPRRDA